MSLPIAPFLFSVPPVDLSAQGLKNPTRYRMTPASFDTPIVEFRDGKAYIGAVPLGDASMQAGGPAAGAVLAVNDQARYGDSVILNLTFAGAGFSTAGSIVLPRPPNRRAALLIVNTNIAGPIYYAWNRDADNVSGIPIVQGGSRNWSGDAVPQNNLSIYSSGAGTVQVEYINITI